MAVELRCPECSAKLRLASAPAPGADVECPKCEAVFSPEPTRAKSRPADDEDDDRPRKTKRPVDDDDDDEDDRPRKTKPARGGDDDEDDKPAKKESSPAGNAPRKRRAKPKDKPNSIKVIIISAIAFVVVSTIIGLLIWRFTRVPVSEDLMSYLPEDTHSVGGVNLRHVRRFVRFFEPIEVAFKKTPEHDVIEAVGKSVGLSVEETSGYVIHGYSPDGQSIAYRTTKDFKSEGFKNLPGAREQTTDGVKYFIFDGFSTVGMKETRIFAPNDQTIVMCPTTVSDDLFRKMLKGNRAAREKTIITRMGPLLKQVTRGTIWKVFVFDDRWNARPARLSKEELASPKGQAGTAGLDDRVAAMAGLCPGFGYRASLGSSRVSVRVVFWTTKKDAKETYLATKKEDSDLYQIAQGDTGTPPGWWKNFLNSMGQKVGMDIGNNISFSYSGELFIVRSWVETEILLGVISTMVGRANPSPSAH